MDMEKVKQKEVWSANSSYLFCGIIFIFLIFALEGCAIRNFFILPMNEAIGLTIILQIPCMLCLIFASFISDWKHRTKFTLYYCKLTYGIDIEYIIENYSIGDIDSNGVLFVKKEDSCNFHTWKVLQGYNSLHETEVKLF